MKTYENLLREEQTMWNNMVFVVKKVSTTDYNYEEWIDVMELYKKNLADKICESYCGADPTVLCISQDLSKPKRPENIPGNRAYELMQK